MIIEKPADEFLQVFIMYTDDEVLDIIEGIIEERKEESPREMAKGIMDEIEEVFGIKIE